MPRGRHSVAKPAKVRKRTAARAPGAGTGRSCSDGPQMRLKTIVSLLRALIPEVHTIFDEVRRRRADELQRAHGAQAHTRLPGRTLLQLPGRAAATLIDAPCACTILFCTMLRAVTNTCSTHVLSAWVVNVVGPHCCTCGSCLLVICGRIGAAQMLRVDAA